jgi:hypothetical protein
MKAWQSRRLVQLLHGHLAPLPGDQQQSLPVAGKFVILGHLLAFFGIFETFFRADHEPPPERVGSANRDTAAVAL